MLDTTTSLDTNTDNHAEQSLSPFLPTSYSCTSCQVSFQNGQEQRVHMKEPWHVYNIKRRIASLPPISLDTFDTQIQKKISTNEASTTSSSDSEISDKDDEQSASPYQCLFCPLTSPSSPSGLASNITHMHIAHSLSIPFPETVTDMQTLIGYLATTTRVWHECLYCGTTRSSTPRIQCHMRDKNHCVLNFAREPGLWDFWERPLGVDGSGDEADRREQEGGREQAPPTHLSATEMRFASGRVVGSRHATPGVKPPSRSRMRASKASATRALPPASGDAEAESLAGSEPLGQSATLFERLRLAEGRQPVEGRQLARREEMSMLGVSDQQRRALFLAEKKAQRSEAGARRAREWVYARGANSREFDQVDNQGKWGKQNHKLLPR